MTPFGLPLQRHRVHPGWPAALGPVSLAAGEVALRPLLRRDGPEWRRLRIRDQHLLEPRDATSILSWTQRHTRRQWRVHARSLWRAAATGEVLSFAVTVDGRFAGQVTLGGIQRGPLNGGWVGYWIESSLHRRRVASVAVALAVGHGLGPVGLHRIEATVAVDNPGSIGVLHRLGFRQEGRLVRYLDVGGGWTDHLLYAITADEVPDGAALLARVLRA